MSDFIAQIRLFIEQKPERGEDCKPVLRLYEDGSGLLAVFDGAGGAGGAFYSDAEGSSFTGAYLASRLGKKTLLDFFDGLKKQSLPFVRETILKELKAQLKKVFKDELAALEPASASKIKSSLIRRLPTTVAAVYYEMPEPAEKPAGSTLEKAWDWAANGRSRPAHKAECASSVFWAGDSRCYLLAPESGLQQLTEDDLKTKADALTNLIEDSPMSNFISADVDFVLNFRQITVNLPAVFIAATDGCFGFVASPAHFEFLLLKTLHFAENAEQWQAALTEEISRIAGDDATLSLVALGWQDFGEISRAFHARLHDVHKTFIAPLGQLDKEIGWLEERSESQKAARQKLLRRSWADNVHNVWSYEYRSGVADFSLAFAREVEDASVRVFVPRLEIGVLEISLSIALKNAIGFLTAFDSFGLYEPQSSSVFEISKHAYYYYGGEAKIPKEYK